MTQQHYAEERIRRCSADDTADMLTIINAAAEAYRGVIPADRWHEPYMSSEELTSELDDRVTFSGCEDQDRLIGVMGVQRRQNVDLIRHAYVLPEWQGHGIGARLLAHLRRHAQRPILVGTWAAADWAIRFYERQGFTHVDANDIGPLLRTYLTVPERQIASSVVLAAPPLTSRAAALLIAEASSSAFPK